MGHNTAKGQRRAVPWLLRSEVTLSAKVRIKLEKSRCDRSEKYLQIHKNPLA